MNDITMNIDTNEIISTRGRRTTKRTSATVARRPKPKTLTMMLAWNASTNICERSMLAHCVEVAGSHNWLLPDFGTSTPDDRGRGGWNRRRPGPEDGADDRRTLYRPPDVTE